jgi:hypothetical protein
MKRLVVALALVTALVRPAAADAATPLMRNAIQSCGFGAAAFAATTYYGLTPALATGTLALPVTEAIAANAIIGCGIGVVGATSATVLGWIYDVIF